MKKFRPYAAVALTLFLLLLALHQVGLDELAATLRQADMGWIIFAFVVLHVCVFESALKWKLLLRSQNVHLSTWYLYKLYLIGIFFNNFLPTTVGGDVVRSYEIGKRINDLATGAASVFAERLTGFVVLVIVAWIAFIVNLSIVNHPILTIIVFVAVISLAGVVWLALDWRLLNLVERLFPFRPVQRIAERFKKFQTALHRYRKQPSALITAFLMSFLFYQGNILYFYVATLAFHAQAQFIDMVLVVPISMIVAMMPFTFNGIGLQEWSFVLLFPLVGLPPSVGLSSIILLRGMTLISSMIGVLFYTQIKANATQYLQRVQSPALASVDEAKYAHTEKR